MQVTKIWASEKSMPYTILSCNICCFIKQVKMQKNYHGGKIKLFFCFFFFLNSNLEDLFQWHRFLSVRRIYISENLTLLKYTKTHYRQLNKQNNQPTTRFRQTPCIKTGAEIRTSALEVRGDSAKPLTTSDITASGYQHGNKQGT